uniref:RNase H type-1 domain-containing protein n=1 Tax=Utricularia reniformis TaxID=192314 RepID=A0A1Y0B0I5_9LAMI|nr:hypothetical protein AEK19_MT0629 [Utricularia reniformis]ART30884.1 hypothetical protein AEK19_MT0629 [Utricularia reniformis]
MISKSTSPEHAEARAAIHALKLGQRLGAQRLILEGDCLTVIQQLRSPEPSIQPGQSSGHSDIQELLSRFPESMVKHVRREANTLAHLLAKGGMTLALLHKPSP